MHDEDEQGRHIERRPEWSQPSEPCWTLPGAQDFGASGFAAKLPGKRRLRPPLPTTRILIVADCKIIERTRSSGEEEDTALTPLELPPRIRVYL